MEKLAAGVSMDGRCNPAAWFLYESGGYLLARNTHFKEIYAQLLMLSANGGMRAAVLYTQNTPTNNWGDCYVNGIYLLPE